MNEETKQNQVDKTTEEGNNDAYNEALKRKYAARETNTSTTPPPANDAQNEED